MYKEELCMLSQIEFILALYKYMPFGCALFELDLTPILHV